MSVIEIKTSKEFKLKIGEKLYVVTQPSYSDIMKFSSSKDKAPETQAALIIELLNKNGLPKDVLTSLPTESVTQIVDLVVGEKKS